MSLHDVTAQRPPLAPILLAAALAGLMMGTSLPLVPLALKLDGHPQWLAGTMTAAWAAGVLVCGPVLPRIAMRFGVVPTYISGLAIIAVAIVLYPHVPKLPWWYLLQFVLGIATSVPWILSETWINLAADSSNRGRVMGYYAFAITAGVAAGPLIATATGPTTATPFYVCALLACTVTLPVLFAARRAPSLQAEGEHGSVWQVARDAPAVLAVAAIAGLCESAPLNFLPIYAVGLGVDPQDAPMWLSVFVVGNMMLMVPLGWLADKRGVRPVLLLCLIVGALLAGLLPLARGDWLWFPAVFLWGGVLFGPYALGLILMGQRFEGPRLAAANSAFVMTYTACNFVAPPTTGAIMDLVGIGGLPLWIAIVTCIALCTMLMRRRG